MNENDRSPAPAPAAPQPDCGISELEAMLARVRAAQKEYATFPQEKVDAIFRAAALAANREPRSPPTASASRWRAWRSRRPAWASSRTR